MAEEPLDTDTFARQLHDFVAKQMMAQQVRMKAQLDAEALKFAEANRLLMGPASLPGTASPIALDDLELLRVLNSNAELKKAVKALVRGYAPPAPEGGKK
jgi:hypothetical protein